MSIFLPPRREWLAYVPLKARFRHPARWFCISITVIGISAGLLGALDLLRVIYLDADASMLILTGLLVAGAGWALWFLESGELVIVKSGLFIGFRFIHWSLVKDIREESAELVIEMPKVRRFWNLGTGILRMPKRFYDVPPDFVRSVAAWRQREEGSGIASRAV